MEKEPVYCPYCGHEMELFKQDEAKWWYWRHKEGCEAFAPSGTTPDEAYQKAQQRFKPRQRPLTWGEVMAHVGWGEAGGYEKMANARPLYLDINPKYANVRKIAKFDNRVFCPWCRGDDLMKMIHRMMLDPGLYGPAMRFWRDEPAPEEMAAAPWE